MRRQRSQPADHGRASRETILDGAFQAFAKGGYRDTAIDDIAAAAEISKGGIYFHFPTKEAIFRELMRTTADKLVGKVEIAVAAESDPIRKAEVALATVLEVFAGHRTMARLFFEAGAGGRGFQAETNALHDRFARLIQSYLDEAVAQGTIPPIDTRLTSVVWFGALDEVVARWLQAARPGPLEDAYPTLRALLLRSVGVAETTIAAGPEAATLATFPELPK
jgi:TetR/AcrR family transcriptional regulator, fatty acid metabolism regulator protein